MHSLLKKDEKEEEEGEEGQNWTVGHVYMHYSVMEEVMSFEFRMAWVHISLLICGLRKVRSNFSEMHFSHYKTVMVTCYLMRLGITANNLHVCLVRAWNNNKAISTAKKCMLPSLNLVSWVFLPGPYFQWLNNIKLSLRHLLYMVGDSLIS